MANENTYTPEVVDLIGGLDFVTPRPSVAPGMLLDCLNFEVSERSGYTMSKGYEGFDGRPSPSSVFNNIYTFSYTVTSGFDQLATGSVVYADGDIITNYWGVVVTTGLGKVTVTANNLSPIYGGTITGSLSFKDSSGNKYLATSIPSIPDWSAQGVTDGTTMLANLQNSRALLRQTIHSGGSFNFADNLANPALGLHWFNDQLYAVQDCYSLYFDTGSAQILPNDTMSISLWLQFTGFIVRDVKVLTGSWAAGNATGIILFSPTDALNGNRFCYDLTAAVNGSNRPHAGDTIVINRGGSGPFAAAKVNISPPAGLPSTWAAFLSRAFNISQLPAGSQIESNQGWQEIDLGYKFTYGTGLTSGPPRLPGRDANPLPAVVSTSALTNAEGCCSSVAVSLGSTLTFATNTTNTNWFYQGVNGNPELSLRTSGSTTNYIGASFTAGTPASSILGMAGYSFPDVPTDAVITGLQVTISAITTNFSASQPDTIQVNLNTATSTTQTPNRTSAAITSSSLAAPTVLTLGGSNDLWGMTQLQVTDLPNIIAQMQVNSKRVGVNHNVEMNYFAITVYYSNSSAIYYFNNGLNNVQAVISNVYQSSGLWASNTSAGTMQVVRVQAVNNAPRQQITSNDAIYSAIMSNTTTTASFVIPAVASTVAMTVASAGTIAIGQFINVQDGSHNVDATVTVVAGTTITIQVTKINQGVAGNTMASGAFVTYGIGTKIATVTSDMTYAGLASQSQLITAGTQYEMIDANFYANKDWNAIYGVSGAGRGFVYDSFYYRQLFTGLTDVLDQPTHLAFNNFHLFLAYPSGAMEVSAAGSPEDFSGVDLATELDTGDEITGLIRLTGTVLAVMCRKSIQAVNGTDPTNFSMSVLSPYEGAIPYTTIDSVKPIYSTYRGISTLDSTDQYGNFLGRRLSNTVTPWVIPRITNQPGNISYGPLYKGAAITKNLSGLALGPLFAMPFRNKNQYRLAFKDGYWLTMTLFGDRQEPQFTIQQFPNTNESNTAFLVPLAHSSSVDSNGADRNHVSAFNSTVGRIATQQPVYEMDKGWTYDNGGYCSGYFTTTQNFFDNPFSYFILRKLRAHGQSVGVNNIKVSVSNDYDYNQFINTHGQIPLNSKPQDISLVRVPNQINVYPTEVSTGSDMQPYTALADVAADGRCFAFQFQASGGPLVIQHLLLQGTLAKADI